MSTDLDAPRGTTKQNAGGARGLVPMMRHLDPVVVLPYVYVVVLGLALYLKYPALVTGPGRIDIRAMAVLPLALIAFGQTLAIATRGIDLSVGGIVSATTAILATHGSEKGFSLALLVVILLALGVVSGLVTGFLVAHTRLQPFIITLAMWSIWDGIAFIILPVEGGTAPSGLLRVLLGTIVGIPKSVIGVAILFLVWFWLRNTRFVVDVKAIGSDEARARLVGVPVAWRKIQVYVFTGFFAALAGIYLTATTNSGAPNAGDQFILNSVACVVIGGASMYGGTGSVASSIIGAIVLLIIPDLVFAFNLTSFWSVFFEGFLLLVAVTVSSLVITVRQSRAV
ncbi:MAG: ABC transporter permease [Acidimicrobiales bacterium]